MFKKISEYFLVIIFLNFFNNIYSKTSNISVDLVIKEINIGNFKKVKQLVSDNQFSYQEKIDIFKAVHDLIQQKENKAYISEKSQESLLATLSLICFVIGPIFTLHELLDYAFRKLITDKGSLNIDNVKIFKTTTLTLLGAMLGYECEISYYTNRSKYIKNFLEKYFGQKLISNITTIYDSHGVKQIQKYNLYNSSEYAGINK